MPSLREELAKLAASARALKEEATLRQYFIGALDQFVHGANLFSIEQGPLFRLDERIIRGKPDSRLGGLVFEVKLPKPKGDGLQAAMKQVVGYIDEYAQQSVKVRGIAYDGISLALLDEQKNIVFEGETAEGTNLLAAWLILLAPEAKTPDDMVNRFGSASALSQSTIKLLHHLFERFSPSVPFIEEVYTIWKALYGCAANINKESVQGLRASAKPLGIRIRGKADAEKFVFALETYLSILLKLLVARVAVEKELVAERAVFRLIGQPAGQEHQRYANLSSLIPHLGNVFEHDPFDWFIDAAREDHSAEVAVCGVLRCIAETIDNVNLVSMGQDFLRIFYQHFFDSASRRALGEFYTNDELVREALDSIEYDGAPGKSIIDFCCGSGNFLVEVLHRIKRKGKNRKHGVVLADIQKNVFGVDIHPPAVAMARVNFIIAVAPLLERDSQLQVPIYWGDSLLRLFRKGKSKRFASLGEVVNISIPGMRPFDLLPKLPGRAEKYFSSDQVESKLRSRQDYKETMPYWCVFRVGPEKLRAKVCWKEVANEMQATRVPAEYDMPLIGKCRLIPLHTAYLVPVEDTDTALVLTAAFNSIPFRAFVMSFAARASGGYFRHFSWTIGLTPIPMGTVPANRDSMPRRNAGNLPGAEKVAQILALAREAARGEAAEKARELSRVISEAYGLSKEDHETLIDYYEFMRPPREEQPDLLEKIAEEESET